MDVELVEVTPGAPFEWRWPSLNVEAFHRTWNGRVSVDGRTVDLRHGLGGREVYGRRRVHAVTWLSNTVMVEGVEADDFPSSRALVSIIRGSDKKHVRALDLLPKGYEGLQVVDHSTEIAAPYSPRSLAVKIVEDDITGWALHATLRAALFQRL